MKTEIKNLGKKTTVHSMRWFSYATFCGIIALFGADASAAVVQRGTAARPTASRVNTASRMPTVVVNNPNSETTTTVETPEPETEPEHDDTAEPVIITDKTQQFTTTLATANTTLTTSGSDTELAEMIRRQRAALDSEDATTTATNSVASGQSACDIGLRQCMQTKCGSDFTKCSGDGDTAWGNKMDGCRRDLKCTGEEYRLFAAEIKADRDLNAQLSAYNKILDCGNRYNDCIATQCGITYSKCLGKTAGDAAIAACATIASECTQQDNGLANRTMQVFATLRQSAEVQVKKDEQRLYALRDQMAAACKSLGAMFDERSLDCVYTVNFFAGNSSTPYASKKAYAGGTFDCNQNWFGIDITTFKENAYRLTREQKSATSAMLGSGVGMATGAITSGAIGRAIDRKKADNALKKAEKEHEENFGDKSDKTQDKGNDADKGKKSKGDKAGTEESKGEESKSRPDNEKLKSGCEAVGGTYKDNFCSNPKCGDDEIYDDWNGKCKKNDNLKVDDQKSRCEIAGGIWSTTTCICPNMGTWDSKTGICGAAQKIELKTDQNNFSLQTGKTNTTTPSLTGGTMPALGTTTGLGTNKTITTPGLSTRTVGTRK